jgi:hypothetical protein
MSPVRYELGFYIPEDGILHSHRRENLESYIILTGWALQRKLLSPVKYEQSHSHRREKLTSCTEVNLKFHGRRGLP